MTVGLESCVVVVVVAVVEVLAGAGGGVATLTVRPGGILVIGVGVSDVFSCRCSQAFLSLCTYPPAGPGLLLFSGSVLATILVAPGDEEFSERWGVGVLEEGGGWLGGRLAGLATRDRFAVKATVFSTVVMVVAAVG